MRKPLVAGNWKMYTIKKEAFSLANDIKKNISNFEGADVVLCPPFTVLYSIYEVIGQTNIQLGAQDVFWDKEGAYTGEISPLMIKDCGCSYVIVGHSERRKYFLETDDMINKKLKKAIEFDLMPICCVGETLEEREKGITFQIIETQLSGCFKNFNNREMGFVVIAYEPVWAIGTGKTASPKQAEEVHGFIRNWINKKFSSDVASSIRILYGGSVKPVNMGELMNEENIDGALVGGASLEANSFVEIIKKAVLQK